MGYSQQQHAVLADAVASAKHSVRTTATIASSNSNKYRIEFLNNTEVNFLHFPELNYHQKFMKKQIELFVI